ncbi:MAG: hypothetical protein HY270_23365 [Deltaproteobacteria bacterium]|nr:hypothetical protein [Deltaproteobacteria bacterium]
MAERLGVSRQCIHAQLRKCGELHAEQLARHDLRQHRQRDVQRLINGFAWTEQHTPGGKALTEFLLQAQARGWAVHVAPRHRPRINGVRLAFHMPQRLRSSLTGHKGATRYYHFQLTRPDWLHVVCLPTGRYIFYMPDLNRPRGSYYIPERAAYEPQVWPEWSQGSKSKRSTSSAGKSVGRSSTRVTQPAWAA